MRMCPHENAHARMRAQVECWTTAEHTSMLYVSIAAIGLYVIGIPVFFAVVRLAHKRTRTTRTLKYTHTLAYTRTQMQTHAQTHAHTYTCTHTCTHEYF